MTKEKTENVGMTSCKVEVSVSQPFQSNEAFKENLWELKKFISGKRVRFAWKQDSSDIFSEIEIPPLSKNEYSFWADWGPMYTFVMGQNEFVQIKLSENDGEQLKYSIDSKMIALNSPMLAQKREMQPHFYVIHDNYRGVIYQIFMNDQGEPDQVTIVKKTDRTAIYETRNLT